jgi:hypothetical protein
MCPIFVSIRSLGFIYKAGRESLFYVLVGFGAATRRARLFLTFVVG